MGSLAAGQRRFGRIGTHELAVRLVEASQGGTGWLCAVESNPSALDRVPDGTIFLVQTANIGEQLDSAPIMQLDEPGPTDDPHEFEWQEVKWSDIGKRLLLKCGVALANATLNAAFSRTYEDEYGRKRDKKTGRFAK